MAKYSENWYEQHSYNVANFAASGNGLSKEQRQRLQMEQNMKEWEWLESCHLDVPFKIGIMVFLVYMAIVILFT